EIPFATGVQEDCGILNLTMSECPEMQGQLQSLNRISRLFRAITPTDSHPYHVAGSISAGSTTTPQYQRSQKTI
ncbi:hypothetical protein, partial [Ralstonia pseudosolanacearum]|uniref:hypothetical protein n=1 Tax=Ralstonia pseudosolanacearum TaxID=1310165 RepID=UPI001FFB6899